MGVVKDFITWVLSKNGFFMQLSGGKLSHRIHTRKGVQMIHQLYMVDRKAEPTGVFASIEMGLLSPGRSFKPNLKQKSDLLSMVFCLLFPLPGRTLIVAISHSISNTRIYTVYIYYILYICITWADLEFVCHSTGKYLIY